MVTIVWLSVSILHRGFPHSRRVRSDRVRCLLSRTIMELPLHCNLRQSCAGVGGAGDRLRSRVPDIAATEAAAEQQKEEPHCEMLLGG